MQPMTPGASTAADLYGRHTILFDPHALEIAQEREAQDAKWGEQNWPDGTGGRHWEDEAVYRRNVNDIAKHYGMLTWHHILAEEVAEAFAETDWQKLRDELVQVAAVAMAWMEAIDRRTG